MQPGKTKAARTSLGVKCPPLSRKHVPRQLSGTLFSGLSWALSCVPKPSQHQW